MNLRKHMMENKNKEDKNDIIKLYVSIFNGKSVCITGTFENASRSESLDFFYKVGATVKKSMVKNLDYLIIANDPGITKLIYADKFNIKKINMAIIPKI